MMTSACDFMRAEHERAREHNLTLSGQDVQLAVN